MANGAASGIGAQIAQSLAQTGTRVALIDGDIDAVRSMATQLSEGACQAEAVGGNADIRFADSAAWTPVSLVTGQQGPHDRANRRHGRTRHKCHERQNHDVSVASEDDERCDRGKVRKGKKPEYTTRSVAVEVTSHEHANPTNTERHGPRCQPAPGEVGTIGNKKQRCQRQGDIRKAP